MPVFEYSGINRNGQKVSGSIRAEAEDEARALLRLLGINARKLGAAGENHSAPGASSAWNPIQRENGKFQVRLFRPRVSGGDLAVFTKQFSTLIDSGVTVVQSLDMLAAQTENRKLREVIPKVRAKVEAGEELADALRQFPEIFNQLYCSLVEAGAAAGQLDVMLRRLSIYIEKANKLTKQFLGALFYPAMVISLSVLLTIGMLVFVVPMFAQNFAETGRELPAPTQFLIDFSNGMRDSAIFWIPGSIAAVGMVNRWRRTRAGKEVIDRLLLKIPLFGQLIVKIALARFASTMAILVGSGIVIIESLEICKISVGNTVVEKDIGALKADVAKGKGLGAPMASSKIIPPMVSGMVSIGESSGNLDKMLAKIAEFYEEEVDAAMAAALKVIEPVMFVVIGAIVGFILIAMYLPVFDMAGGIQ